MTSLGTERGTERGFTLIELLAVLVIVSILALAAHPLQELVHRRVQEQALREGLRQLRMALDDHKRAVLARRIKPGFEGSAWPTSLLQLVQGVPLLDDKGEPQNNGPRMYFLRRLPRDPFADAALAAAESWGQRASTSPPDAPQAGADVFDVYSRSERQALDGSRYRDW
jgi:general secretion pathway protein G